MNINFQSAKMKRKSTPVIEKKLGEILVERDIISPRHLQIALDRQKIAGKYKYIGEILIEMGIPREKINEVLDAYDKRRPLGQVCLDLKIIRPDQLQKALEKQGQLAKMAIRKPLGKLLVEMGFTNIDEFMDALSKHFNIPTVSLRNFFPSPSLQRAVGEKYAQKHRIVVLENYSAKIKLALPEPNPLVMDELRRVFSSGKRVEFCLATPIDIDYCLSTKFDPFSISHYR